MNKTNLFFSCEPRRRHAAARLAAVAVVLVIAAAFVVRHQFAVVGQVELTAHMGDFSPSLVKVKTAVTATLTAGTPYSYTNPSVPPTDESSLVPSYTWSVSPVQVASASGGPYRNAILGTDYTIGQLPATASTVSTLTFTPLVTGYWKVSVSCSVVVTDTKTNQKWDGGPAASGPKTFTSYTFNITYTGSVYNVNGNTSDADQVVTNNPGVPVHAGWPIQLGAALSPSDLASKFTWTIAGAGGNGSAAINGYVRNVGTGDPIVPGSNTSLYSIGVVVPLDPSADTKSTFPDPSSPGILKYYYYTKADSFTASVNFQGGSAATTTFSVAKYTETMQNSYTSGVVSTPQPGGGVQLSLGPPHQFDQIFFQQNPDPGDGAFAGTLHFVQIYTENDTWTGNPAKGIANYSVLDAGLDTTYYYGNESPPPSAVHTGDAPSTATDNNYIKMVIDDTPAMWAMYQPKASGSIVVPLAEQGWEWGGTETLNLNTGIWTPTNKMPANPGTLSPLAPTNDYPEWSKILPLPNPPH